MSELLEYNDLIEVLQTCDPRVARIRLSRDHNQYTTILTVEVKLISDPVSFIKLAWYDISQKSMQTLIKALTGQIKDACDSILPLDGPEILKCNFSSDNATAHWLALESISSWYEKTFYEYVAYQHKIHAAVGIIVNTKNSLKKDHIMPTLYQFLTKEEQTHAQYHQAKLDEYIFDVEQKAKEAKEKAYAKMLEAQKAKEQSIAYKNNLYKQSPEWMKHQSMWGEYGPQYDKSENQLSSGAHELFNSVPGLKEKVKCPKCHVTRDLFNLIQHINDNPDSHHMTRNDIADWLESLDVNLEIQMGDTPNVNERDGQWHDL